MAAELETTTLEQLRTDDELFVADTGASHHSSKCSSGGTNVRDSNRSSYGHTGEAVETSFTMDIPGQFIDKNGAQGVHATLRDVSYNPKYNFNLCSLTKLLQNGWALSGNQHMIVAEKDGIQIKFDIVIPTASGAIYAGRFRRRSMELAAASGDATTNNKVHKTNITTLHALLGHSNEDANRQSARALGIELSRGSLHACEDCAKAKAKQKNVCKKSLTPKATKAGQRLFDDITKVTVSKSDGDEFNIKQKYWCTVTDEATGKKWCIFTSTKDGMVEPVCTLVNELKSRGIDVKYIRMDPGGENIKLEKRMKSAAWGPKLMPINFEFTSTDTPQHNSKAETSFPTIAGRSRAMINAARVPDSARGKVAIQAITAAVLLDGLNVVTINGKSATRDEHVFGKNPSWSKNMKVWGTAGVVKTGKDGKTGNRGTTMMFVGYAGRESDSFRMWNPTTNRVVVSRDIIWLNKPYFQREEPEIIYVEQEAQEDQDDEANNEDNPSAPDVEEANAQTESEESAAGESVVSDAADTPRTSNTLTRIGRTVILPSRYRQDIATVAANKEMTGVQLLHLAQLDMLNNTEVTLNQVVAEEHELGLVGAGIDDGIDTDQLKVLNYKQAMNSINKDKFVHELKKEKKRFDKYKVLTPYKREDLPSDAKIMSTVWAFKQKADGSARGRMNARGYEQHSGVHYEPDSISSPVTNSNTIRVCLTLYAAQKGWVAAVIDVEAAFLQGKFYNGEVMYIDIPEGFEEYYPEDCVLKMNVPLYGTKQAAACFHKTLIEKLRDKRNVTRSMADPCMYHTHIDGRLVVILSWIDDLLVLGEPEDVELVLQDLESALDCKREGEMKEYVGNVITATENANGTRTLKLLQPVLVRKLKEQYDVPNEDDVPRSPAAAKEILVQGDGKGALLDVEAAKEFRSATALMLYMTQWSRPDMANAVRNLARQMSNPNEAHVKALYRAIRYIVSTPNRGLEITPSRPWDGKSKLVIRGRSDSDYATNPDDRRSVTGSVVYMEDALVMSKSATQRHVTLSVTEAEGAAGVTCAQDMLYVHNVVTSLGIDVELPMLLEIDNKGAVDLANNWSVGGRTRHVDVRNHFLRELKERGMLVIKHVPGVDNEADIYTKNVSPGDFEKHIKHLVGVDEYMNNG